MKISDLDIETRKVIYVAHVVSRRLRENGTMFSDDEGAEMLWAALDQWDKKHEAERNENAIKGIFGGSDFGKEALEKGAQIGGPARDSK